MPCGASCRWRRSMERSFGRIRARPSWPAASGRPHEWVAHRCITALRTKRRLRNTPTNAERRLAGPAFAPRPARLCHVVTAEWDTTRTKLVARVLRTPREAAYPRLRSCEGDRLQARKRTDGPNDTTGPSSVCAVHRRRVRRGCDAPGAGAGSRPGGGGAALGRRDRPLGFFQCWTRKEAFIKALGDGLSYPLDRFDVSLAPGEPAEILRVEAMPGACCGWRMESLSPAPGFVAAVVIGDRE